MAWMMVAGLLGQLFFLPTPAQAALFASQESVDVCDDGPCGIDASGGDYGVLFRGAPLSTSETDFVTNVEIFIVKNDAIGYTIQICDVNRCASSPPLDDGVTINNQWRGFDFSQSSIRLNSLDHIYVYGAESGVEIGGTAADSYPDGVVSGDRSFRNGSIASDLAFRVYGNTFPHLSVTIAVNNNDGGELESADFPVHLFSDPDNVETPYETTSGGLVTYAAAPSAYRLEAYHNAVLYSVTYGGDCAANGSLVLNMGDNKTCSVTADDVGIARARTPLPEQSDRNRGPTVNLSGKAFPGAQITLVKKSADPNSTSTNKVTVPVATNGDFSITNIPAESLAYALVVKDAYGRDAQTKVFNRSTINDALSIKDIFISPTIDVVRPAVTKGGFLKVVGSAYPNTYVQLRINSDILFAIRADAKGLYRLSLSTAKLAVGQYSISARQHDSVSQKDSDFSVTKIFMISDLPLVAADLNGDNAINITDWSIFLEKWRQVKGGNTELVSAIDFNNDSVVNISDFAIFLKAFSKK